MAPIPSFLTSSGSKKNEPRYVYLSEAKASHSHKMWTEVSSSVPHFLRMGCVMSNEQANNNPGLCPIKGQQLGPHSQNRGSNPTLSLCTRGTMPQRQVLFLHSAFHFSSYIPPSDPQERFRSNKPLNRTTPCGLFGDFISSHSGMPQEPIEPHSRLGRDIIQHLLALSYQRRRCFSSLKHFQIRLAIKASTNIFLWLVLSFIFMNTG